MSSSDEAYYTPGNSPKKPPEHSPAHSPEHSHKHSLGNSPENSSGELPAEHAKPHPGDINPVNVSNTIYECTRLQGDQRLDSPSNLDPQFYPVYILDFASGMEPENSPVTILFKRSPISRPTNSEMSPLGPTVLMEASFSTDSNSRPRENAAKFGPWIAHEPGTQTMIPQGSWVFFPLIGAKS